MVAHAKRPYMTLEAYFAQEDRAETKSEYFDGEIVAMAGASPAHIRITTNLAWTIGNQLDGKPCEPFDSDLRIYVEACNSVFYPDFTVVCEPPRFAATRMATLLNPTLLVEVLSESTEAKDRGEKFACYQTLDSLSAYVLIAQDRPRIEVFTRWADGSWRYDATNGLEAALTLDTIGITLRLTDVHARVEFLPASPAEAME